MHTTKARNPLMTIVRALFASRRRVVVLAAIAVLAVGAAAFAYWTPETGSGGSGSAAATSVNQGPTPAVTTQDGRKVDVSWGASNLDAGQAVDDYTVKRYDADTDTLATTLASCTGTITGLSCTESNVPTGSWKYTVTPQVGHNWVGHEGDKSGAVTVANGARTA